MAFTIEEIENLLPISVDNNPTYKSNYKTIVDYLTGETTILNPIVQDWSSNAFIVFSPLIKNIESPSINEQLVFDVFLEPYILQTVKNNFLYGMCKIAIAQNTRQALDALLKLFLKVHYTSTEMFDFLLYKICFNNKMTLNKQENKSVVKDFVLQFIKQHGSLRIPVISTLSRLQTEWSSIYFQLLEAANLPVAKDYINFSLSKNSSAVLMFLSTYENGLYIPDAVNFIEQEPKTLYAHELNLKSIIHLLEKDEQTYHKQALRIAKRFLNFYQKQNSYSNWESGIHLSEFNNTPFGYLPYSTCAFHVLLKYDKANTIAFLNEWLNDKIILQPQTLKIIYHHLSQDALPIFKLALGNTEGGIDYLSTTIHLLAQHFKPDEYIDDIWKLIGIKSKNIKNIVVDTLAEKDPEAEAKSIILLENKKTETRQTAAIILSKFNTPNSQATIIKTINQETNDNTRDILLATVAHTLPAETTEVFVQEMTEAAAKRGKLAKPQETWLDESELPLLFYQNKLPLEANAVRFLLYRMSRVKTMQSDIEAKYLIQLLDKETAAPFAKALIKIFIDKGAKPDHKYLLAIAALLGNDEIVDFIARTINKWMEENRYKMAEYGVGALAIQGSNKALRKVEWYSRKYKAKKANVGAAALLALETAAEELGITTHELGDRVVPDFGFEGLFKSFEINGESFRAFIDSNFKIAYFNDDNKKLKALPANASKDLKEDFKDIGKEVRDIVKSQSSRLEYYLIIQRRWTVEQWQNFFLQNPVMFIYATKLLWGVYDRLGHLTSTFLCTEDTSLINVESDEIELPESDGFIGMVHPTQLSATELQAWKKQIFDQSIQPIFSQLDRPTADLTDIEMNKAIITKYNERQTENESIRNTLEKRGWHKGPTGDGGMIESYNLLYFEKRLEAVLEIEGVGAGYGWGGDEKLGKLYVVDKSKAAAKWFTSPQKDDDETLVKLKDVPVIFLNEMLAAVEAIKVKVKKE